MKPSIGRIVHYVSSGHAYGEFEPEHHAAIVTQVHSEKCVSLAVFGKHGVTFALSVASDEVEKKGNTWHWPEREDA